MAASFGDEKGSSVAKTNDINIIRTKTSSSGKGGIIKVLQQEAVNTLDIKTPLSL